MRRARFSLCNFLFFASLTYHGTGKRCHASRVTMCRGWAENDTRPGSVYRCAPVCVRVRGCRETDRQRTGPVMAGHAAHCRERDGCMFISRCMDAVSRGTAPASDAGCLLCDIVQSLGIAGGTRERPGDHCDSCRHEYETLAKLTASSAPKWHPATR